MCVQYRGDVQCRGGYHEYRGGYHEYRGGIPWVPWGVQYRGGYHDKCGGYLEYRGGVQYRGGYHEYRGGYHEYRGGYHEYCGVILSTVGVFSIVEGYHDARGGYHEYRGGCSVLWGTQIMKDFKILLTMLAHNRPKSERQCFNRAICYFKIEQGEATAICLRSGGKCRYWKQFCTEREESLSLPLN